MKRPEDALTPAQRKRYDALIAEGVAPQLALEMAGGGYPDIREVRATPASRPRATSR